MKICIYKIYTHIILLLLYIKDSLQSNLMKTTTTTTTTKYKTKNQMK
jgi:hypothetical protein